MWRQTCLWSQVCLWCFNTLLQAACHKNTEHVWIYEKCQWKHFDRNKNVFWTIKVTLEELSGETWNIDLHSTLHTSSFIPHFSHSNKFSSRVRSNKPLETVRPWSISRLIRRSSDWSHASQIKLTWGECLCFVIILVTLHRRSWIQFSGHFKQKLSVSFKELHTEFYYGWNSDHLRRN